MTIRPSIRDRRLPGRLRLVALVPAAALLLTACLPPTSRGSVTGGSAAPDGGGSPAVSALPLPTGPTPRPSFIPPTPTPAPTFRVHVVVGGENLNSIAQQYGTTARSLAFWNRATYPSLDPDSPGYRPNLLKVGWTLQLIPNLVFDGQELSEPSGSLPAG